MCGYSELMSSDPEVRNYHRTVVGIGAVVVLTVLGLLGTLVFVTTRKSVPQNEVAPQPEVETTTTVL